jgi:hypothetical protein
MLETTTTAPIQVTTTQIQQELLDVQIEVLLKYYEVDSTNPFQGAIPSAE